MKKLFFSKILQLRFITFSFFIDHNKMIKKVLLKFKIYLSSIICIDP